MGQSKHPLELKLHPSIFEEWHYIISDLCARFSLNNQTFL